MVTAPRYRAPRPRPRRAPRHGSARRGRGRASRPGPHDDPCQRRLAGEADEHGPSDRDDAVEAPDELEVLVGRLPEADPGVEADPLLGDAGRDREREPLLEERRDLRDDVLVARRDLHRARLSLHVHEAEIRSRLRDHSCEIGLADEGGDVVDHDRPESERQTGHLGA
jgi:hypothetical protein